MSKIKKIIWRQMGIATDSLAVMMTHYNFQPGKFLVVSTPDPLRVIVLYVESEK